LSGGDADVSIDAVRPITELASKPLTDIAGL
jgi:hypothetical protein